MNNYEFSFGYLALKMLGKTLYSNPFAAMSELIANGFDARANKIWIYIDIRRKNDAIVEVIDNGLGMSDDDVRTKYLQVGKLNRDITNKSMMGRKGIGKLAAFYLSNNYYILTKNGQQNNSYEIDFRECENNPNFTDYMKVNHNVNIVNMEIFNGIETGTCIRMNCVNFAGYGEKAFSVLPHDLSEYFAFCNSDKSIYLKLVKNDSDLNKNYIKIEKQIAFKNMCKIYYNLDDTDFSDVIKLNGKEIVNADKKVKDNKVNISVERIKKENPMAAVDGKPIILKPFGWIGIHQTINREMANKNDPKNFINSEFYHFNKVRIYVRKKLALENILPLVHNTQYYANYIEGEIHCDELDDNDFPDIASSSRQDLDKNDARVIKLIEYVKDLVKDLVNYKGDQAKNDEQLYSKKQDNAVKEISNQVEESLTEYENKNISKNDIQNIKHSLINSFQTVKESVKTDYKLFFSHKRDDKKYSDFFYNYLIGIKGFTKEMIFYSSRDGGIDESIESLEKQVIENLTQTNSYATFFICSNKFKKSEYCMFEGGAAWAVKQNSKIGLIYLNYGEIPEYLKNMKNSKYYIKNQIDRDGYISLVNMLNSMIQYLNNNYSNDSDKKALIECNIPNDAELKAKNETCNSYFDADIISYWNSYIGE